MNLPIMIKAHRWILGFVLCFGTTLPAFAIVLPLPAYGDVIGQIMYVRTQSGDTLNIVGKRYSIGYHEMVAANPNLPPVTVLSSGTQVEVPSLFILPPGPRVGIVINLAELRLYYFPPLRNVVITEPIAIGREGRWQTPEGMTEVKAKTKDPTWRPTENVRAEAARQGTPIPAVFPPGPDNPLGHYVLYLGWPTYEIHGTNRPDDFGGRVSAGCIRMMPQAIEALFQMVEVGTPVRIINVPFKSGWSEKGLYFEAHPLLEEVQQNYSENTREVVLNLSTQVAEYTSLSVRWALVQDFIRQASGIPNVVAWTG